MLILTGKRLRKDEGVMADGEGAKVAALRAGLVTSVLWLKTLPRDARVAGTPEDCLGMGMTREGAEVVVDTGAARNGADAMDSATGDGWSTDGRVEG